LQERYLYFCKQSNMTKLIEWVLEKIKSINHAIWHTPLSEISKRKSILIKQLRVIVLASRGFSNDKVQLRASALTFYSLLSVIPMVAIGFGIAKGFGLDQNLEEIITQKFQSHKEVLNWLLSISRSALQETSGGYIAGIGFIILFWSVMGLLNHIESSFNHIWQIRASRPWFRKFTDYLTIMLVAPVFIILSSSITVFISTELTDFMTRAPILDIFKPLVTLLVQIIPYFLSWVALTVMFIIMPNAKVIFQPAVVAGIVAGTCLQVVQWLYIDLQFGITKLSAIYGSFAAIPLFIVWIQSSWIIVLLGAELSFANQNVSHYEFESEALNISNYQKRALIILIMNLIVRNFSTGEPPLSAENISSRLKLPVRLARDVLQDLNQVGLVSRIQVNENKERLYQPAMDINKLTVSFVLGRLDNFGAEQTTVLKNKDYEKVVSMLGKFDKMIAKSDSNVLIKDL
jgi:membrane protein